MKVLELLLGSFIGQISLFVIVFMLGMAAWFIIFFLKKSK